MAIGAHLLNAPPNWIGVGVLCLIGVAVVHGVTGEIILAHASAGGEAVFVIGGTGEHADSALGPVPAQDGGLIARQDGVQRRGGQGLEGPLAGVVIRGQRTPFAGAEEQVLKAIAVEIEPTDAGPQLAQAPGQQGLALKVIE